VEVIDVLPTTLDLHVRDIPQRRSQAIVTNDIYKQAIAAAVIFSIVTRLSLVQLCPRPILHRPLCSLVRSHDVEAPWRQQCQVRCDGVMFYR